MSDWVRLGVEVRKRREQLKLSRAAVWGKGGPSDQTLLRIEQGNTPKTSYQRAVLMKLEDALEWPPGTVQAILGGVSEDWSRPAELHAEAGGRVELRFVSDLDLIVELMNRLSRK